MGAGTATLSIALASVCFGLVPLFARELQADGVPDAAIAFYRFAFSAAVLLPFLPLARATRRAALGLGLAGAGLGLGWTGYLHMVEAGSVATAGVIYLTYPVFAVLFGWALLGVRPSPRTWTACALVLAAAGLVFAGEGAGPIDPVDALYALAAPVSFGLVIVMLARQAQALGALERMACLLVGTLAGLVPLLWSVAPGTIVPSDGAAWLSVLGLCAVTALVPQLLYTLAAPVAGPARSAAAGSLELPTMIVVGWLAFAETVGPREVVAAGLVLAAIAVSPTVAPRQGRRAG